MHLPHHETSYECDTKVKEWVGAGPGEKAPSFIADTSGAIMVNAHVRFATVNCFCKEMGVFGQVGGEPGVCK